MGIGVINLSRLGFTHDGQNLVKSLNNVNNTTRTALRSKIVITSEGKSPNLVNIDSDTKFRTIVSIHVWICSSVILVGALSCCCWQQHSVNNINVCGLVTLLGNDQNTLNTFHLTNYPQSCNNQQQYGKLEILFLLYF